MQLSYDRDAGTLYWYFVELDADEETEELECPVSVLLDDARLVAGIQLDLSDLDDHTALVSLALPYAEARWDDETKHLRLVLAPYTSVEALPEPAFLDVNSTGQILGIDVADVDHETTARYTILEPHFISLEEEVEDGIVLPEVDETVVLPEVERAGIVAILGRPNVGKSTLLNAIVGQKVAITSPKPQTTRTAIRGILTRSDAQIIFVDTPGVHRPRNRLGTFMVQQARQAVPDADVVCMVVDITHMPNELDERIAAMIQRTKAPKILVLNKVDRPNPNAAACLEAFRALAPWTMEIAISALRKQGVDALVDQIVALLPTGQAFYAADTLTDQNERTLCAELVRERIMHLIGDEVPYGVAVEVEEWETRPNNNIYIRMTIHVEKDSQKAILIGKGGAMLKRIGTDARPAIERMLQQRVFLDLWIKPRDNWRDDPSALHWLGYNK